MPNNPHYNHKTNAKDAQVNNTDISTQHELTKNKCGYMHPLSETSRAFIRYAANSEAPVVDIGCAYGIATIEAAKCGAQRIVACDTSNKHLQILQDRAAKAGVQSRITVKCGKFPESISFPPNSVGAILASLVLAYLNTKELEQGLKNMFRWLIPGGKLFIVSYSIYIKEFTNPTFQSEYQRRINSGNKWPGYFEDFNQFSTMEKENISDNAVPVGLHFFDIDPLVIELRSVGFEIESAKYLDGKANGAVSGTWNDGREMLGIVAKKPTLASKV